MASPPRRPTLFPYTTLFRSGRGDWWQNPRSSDTNVVQVLFLMNGDQTNFRTFASRGVSTRVSHVMQLGISDRKSTRLNASHRCISYAVFCLKKKSIISD